jgi:hypothetical protein
MQSTTSLQDTKLVCEPNADTPSTFLKRSDNKRITLLTAIQRVKHVGTGNEIALKAEVSVVSWKGLCKVVMGLVR